jgi:hypothetical protein
MPIVLAIIAGQSKDSRNTMNDVGVQKRKGTAPLPEPELTLVPQSANAPDPRLIEFVRLLARHADGTNNPTRSKARNTPD